MIVFIGPHGIDAVISGGRVYGWRSVGTHTVEDLIDVAGIALDDPSITRAWGLAYPPHLARVYKELDSP